MHFRATVADRDNVFEIGVVDLMGGELVQRPSRRECREKEAVQGGIDAGRHRRLDDFDAPARVVGQMLRDERLAESLNSRFLDDPLAGIPVELAERCQLRLWPSLAQMTPHLKTCGICFSWRRPVCW